MEKNLLITLVVFCFLFVNVDAIAKSQSQIECDPTVRLLLAVSFVIDSDQENSTPEDTFSCQFRLESDPQPSDFTKDPDGVIVEGCKLVSEKCTQNKVSFDAHKLFYRYSSGETYETENGTYLGGQVVLGGDEYNFSAKLDYTGLINTGKTVVCAKEFNLSKDLPYDNKLFQVKEICLGRKLNSYQLARPFHSKSI